MNERMNQSINQSINQSNSQWLNQATNLPKNEGINQRINQRINQSINQSNNQSVNQSTNPSIKQSIKQSINESINESIHPSIHPSIHQSAAVAVRCSQVRSPSRSLYSPDAGWLPALRYVLAALAAGSRALVGVTPVAEFPRQVPGHVLHGPLLNVKVWQLSWLKQWRAQSSLDLADVSNTVPSVKTTSSCPTSIILLSHTKVTAAGKRANARTTRAVIDAEAIVGGVVQSSCIVMGSDCWASEGCQIWTFRFFSDLFKKYFLGVLVIQSQATLKRVIPGDGQSHL